jgi:Ca-activated chloride channel family protein
MKHLLYIICAALAVGVIGICSRWTDSFHFVTGFGALLLGGTAVGSLIWMKTRSQPKLKPVKAVSHPVQDSPVRSVFLGLLTGLAIALCLWVSFGAFKRWPAYASRFYDADRSVFEQQLRAHEIGGHHDQAASLLRERLRRKMTSPWRETLNASLYSNLVAAARRTVDPTQQVRFLSEARDLAKSTGLDPSLALALLEPVSQEIEFAARIEKLRAAKQWQEIADSLRGPLRERPCSPQTRPLAQAYYEALVSLAETASGFSAKKQLLEESLALARRHELNASEAAVRLQEAQAAATTQTELVSKIARLKSDRAWPELVSRLKFIIADTPKATRPQSWDKDLFDALCAWAVDSSDVQVKLAKLQEAVSVAKDYQLDPAFAANQIKAIETDKEARANFGRRVAQFQAQGSWSELVAFLRVGLDRPRAEWPQPLDELLYDAQIRWADATTDPKEKGRLLQQALDSAKVFKLNARLAESRLKALEDQLAEARRVADAQKRLADEQRRLAELLNRPADLPPSARAGLASVSAEFVPPSFDVEVFVEDAQGRPIRNLAKKDFVFACRGRAPRNIELAAIQRDLPPLQLLVALDVSGSMDGAAMTAAIQAARDLILSFAADETVWVKVITFGSNVRTACDWTKDKNTAASALLGVRAVGETALFEAVAQAEQDLRTRPGERKLFLFTDGKNTIRWRGNLGNLSGDLLRAEIKVLAIGLRTHDLDRGTLTQLTTATAGAFLEADSSAQIASAFQNLRRRLRQAVYRFSVTPETPDSADNLPLQIKVGTANAVVIYHTLPRSRVTTAAN